MPTNFLRNETPARARMPVDAGKGRRVLIKAGRISLEAELLDTATAARVWAALPLYSTVETWGGAVHFETPVGTGRERAARVHAEPGDICYWTEEDRVIIAFGRTPISKPGEMRLPRPWNVWAKTADDVTALASVTPGEKVSLTAVKNG